MIKDFSVSSFIIGIIIGILIASAWFLGSNFALISIPVKTPSSSFTATSTTPTPEDSGTISITNQSAGDVVIVESVTVPPPGVWVAVRDVNGNDLGNVLGAVRVDGPRSSVSISLLRSTEPNQSYAIELYRDDGGGEFNPAVNSVYVDFNTGEPVIEYFTTTE